jgi:hypothetical protein
MKYGYARVSTDSQSVDAQVRQLTKAGCEVGDVPTMTRLDRLTRSTRDLLDASPPSPARRPDFGRWATHGPTPPRHTGS